MEPEETKKDVSISRESAEAQLRIFEEFYGTEILGFPEMQGEAGVNQVQREQLLVRIMSGLIEITNEKGLTVRQYLKNPPGKVEVIGYCQLKASHKKAMDVHKGHAMHQRMHALAGALSGLGETAIGNLTGPDNKTMELLMWLFLNV